MEEVGRGWGVPWFAGADGSILFASEEDRGARLFAKRGLRKRDREGHNGKKRGKRRVSEIGKDGEKWEGGRGD